MTQEDSIRILEKASTVYAPEWAKAFQCAFRPKSKGEGILLNEDRLKAIGNEIDAIVKPLKISARKISNDEVYGPGKDWSWYEDSRLPPLPKNFDEKKREFLEHSQNASIKEKAIKNADIENSRSAHKLRRNSNDYAKLIKKHVYDLSMKATFGENTEYKSFEDFRYGGVGKRFEDFKPKDSSEKSSLQSKREKEIYQDLLRQEIAKDPEIVDKDRCLTLAHNYHVANTNHVFSFKFEGEREITRSYLSSTSEEVELGDSVNVALGRGYPILPKIPTSAIVVESSFLGSSLGFRSDKMNKMKTLEKIFSKDAIKKAKEKNDMMISLNDFTPYGWHVIKNEENKIIIGNPAPKKVNVRVADLADMFGSTQREAIQYVTPTEDEVAQLGPKYSYCSSVSSSNGKWNTKCHGELLPNKQVTHATKKEAISYMKCNMSAFEKAYPKAEPLLKEIVKNVSHDYDKVRDLQINWIKNDLSPILKKEQSKC